MAQVPLVKRLAAQAGFEVYTSFNRTVYLLLLFTLGKGFQLSIGALTLNLYVHSLGYSLEFVGFFAATSALGSLIAAVPIGVLADRMGRKPLLLISGFGTPLTLVMTALSTTPVLLIVSGLLNGLLASAYWVTNLPMLTESTTEEQRIGAMALNNFLLLGVGALGALVGGGVPEIVALVLHQSAQDVVPLRFGILAAAVIVFLPAIPLLGLQEPGVASRFASAVPPPSAPTISPADAAAGAESRANLEIDAAESEADQSSIPALFAKLLIPDILFTTGEGAVVGLLSLFFFLQFSLGPGPLGVFFTLAGLIGGATSLTAPRIVQHFGQLRMATLMQFLTVPVMLLIGFSPVLSLAVLGEFIRQILRGLEEPVYVTFAMGRVTERHRGTLSGFYSLTWSVGFSLGPITAGWLQQHIGLSSPFVIAAFFVGLSGVLLRFFFAGTPPMLRTGDSQVGR
jgi:MFS family permease